MLQEEEEAEERQRQRQQQQQQPQRRRRQPQPQPQPQQPNQTNHNNNNKNKKKKKHKNATNRCVTSCGMKRTSYCALHLRARAKHMNNTNAHTTITLMASPVCEARQLLWFKQKIQAEGHAWIFGQAAVPLLCYRFGLGGFISSPFTSMINITQRWAPGTWYICNWDYPTPKATPTSPRFWDSFWYLL